jgi:hypothetical protein
MFIAYALSRLVLPEKTSVILLFISSFLIAAFLWSAPVYVVKPFWTHRGLI